MALAPDSPQNSKLVNRINARIKYIPNRRMNYIIESGYQDETYTLSESMINNVPITRRGQLFHIGFRGEYNAVRGFIIYSEIWQDNAKDNILGNYIDSRFTVGTRIEY
jgi:hypothetical protein